MRRFVALILLTALALTVFSACSFGKGPELLSFISDNEKDEIMDLNGRIVTICSEAEIDVLLFEQLPNTAMYDAILKRLDEIGLKYNCSVEHVTHGFGSQSINYLISLASTADSTIDIIYGHGDNSIGKLAYGGILYPLTLLKDYLDYENSEKFGTAGLLESAMVDGVPYAIQPVQWLGFPNGFAYILAWNVDGFTKYGLPHLHEFYENETWTWDKFEALFDTYTQNAETGLNLISIYKPFFSLSAMMSNGVKLWDYDGEQFYCDLNAPKTHTAIDWALKLYNENESIIAFTNDAYSADDFTTEMTLMKPVQIGTAALSIPYDSEFVFGLMPFPCGPDGTYGEWANFVHAIRGFGISNFSDIPEASAMILNDLVDPFPEISSENGLMDYYSEQVFYSPIDADIYLNSGKFARSVYNAGNMGMWKFAEAAGNGSNAAQVISSFEGVIETFIEEELRSNYEKYVYDHLYGDKAN